LKPKVNNEAAAATGSARRTWIAFASDRPAGTLSHIWLIRPDGKGLHRLTSTADEYHPSWSR
jgi:Tol biopolymer transport system component